MQVWTSSQVGATCRHAGAGFEVWFGGQSGAPVQLSRTALHNLFADANDVVETTVPTAMAAQQAADLAWGRDRALRFTLIALDPAEDGEELEEIKFLANGLLQNKPAWTYCLNQFAAAPLPEPHRAMWLVNDERYEHLASLMKTVVELQGAITEIHQSFNQVTEAQLPAAERAIFLEAALERGVFRKLAVAFASGADRRFAALEAQQAMRGVTSQTNSVILDLIGGVPDRMPVAPLEADEDFEGGDKSRLRPDASGFVRLENVLAQQKEIRRLLRYGEVQKARTYVDQLIAQQEQEGAEYAAKTLCSLAQEAKHFGLSTLHYEWSARAVEIRPEDAWAQGQKADGLVTLGRFGEAEQALAHAEGKYPAFVATNLARILRRKGDLEGALEAYVRAKEEFEGSDDEPYAWVGIAEIYRELGDLEQALGTYDEAAQRFPGEPMIASGKAGVLVDLGQYADALSDLSRALASSSGNLNAMTGIASVYREQGDFERALAEYDGILAKYPDEPVVQCGRAEVLRLDGRLPEALLAYSDAINEFPFIEAAYVGKGRVLVQQGRYSEATDFYEAASVRFPNSMHISSGFAALAVRKADWHTALSVYDKIIRSSARNLRARLEKARVLNRMGQPQLAEIELKQLLEVSPGYLPARNEMASSLYLMGEFQRAFDITQYRGNPKSQAEWAMQFVRAISLDKLEKSEAAAHLLERGRRAANPRVRRYMSSALALLKLRENRINDARLLVDAAAGEASEVISLHVSAVSRDSVVHQLVAESVETPALQSEVRAEIVRRFRVIEGGLSAQHPREWLFEEETKLLLFDATSEDWWQAAA